MLRSGASVPFPPRKFILILAGLIWLVIDEPQFWAVAVAYLGAWLMLSLAVGFGLWPRLELTRSQVVCLSVALLAPVLMNLYSDRYRVAKAERLRGLPELTIDRLALEGAPALFPAVIFGDHPQTLYGYSPDTTRLQLSVAARPVEGQHLGNGLFRFQYRPEDHGSPPRTSGPSRAQLIHDGKHTEIPVTVVHPTAHPRWFCSSPEAGLAATVSRETDELLVVDREGGLQRLEVADGPSDCALSADGTLAAVTHRYSSRLLLIDLKRRDQVAALDIGSPQRRLALSPEGDQLAIAVLGDRPRIELLSFPQLERIDSVDLDHEPDWIVYGTDRNSIVVSSRTDQQLLRIDRLDSGESSVAASISLGRPAVTLARSDGGMSVLAAVTDLQLDGPPHRGNHFIQDQIVRIDVGSLKITETIPTPSRTPRQRSPGNFDSGTSPMSVLELPGPTPEKSDLLIAFAGSSEVIRLGEHGRHRLLRAGKGQPIYTPHGLAGLGAGRWVVSSPSRGRLAIYEGLGEVSAGFTESSSVQRIALHELNSELGAFERSATAGERAFYETTRSGISCQSCHLHGDSDFSQHDIGQRTMVSTLSTRGIAGTAPYLRDASFPRVRDLLGLANGLYRGYLRRSNSRGDDLEAYITSLPLRSNAAFVDTADLDRERRGREAFDKARCSLCHTFPAFTNLGQHLAWSLFPEYSRTKKLRGRTWLDTPSLRGVGHSPPYLHDGRAKDLRAVLVDHNTDNRHGDVAALEQREIDDLIYFLRGL